MTEDVTSGQDQLIAEIEELIALAKQGEIRCGAFRLFNKDGTWKDVAIGGTPEDRERLLHRLREQVAAPMGGAANDK